MKKSKQITLAVFISVFAIGIAKGFYKSYKADQNVVSNILKVLKENCNCEAVTQTMYAKGVQYSKENGFSSKKVEYQLLDCNYQNLNEEVKRIDKLLQDEVTGIKNFNLITLDFVSHGEHKTVTINNTNESKKE